MSVDWRELAACRGLDPDLFHPRRGDKAGYMKAKSICEGCPVRWQCLNDRMVRPETDADGTVYAPIGVVGGVGGRQRRLWRQDASQIALIASLAEQEAAGHE